MASSSSVATLPEFMIHVVQLAKPRSILDCIAFLASLLLFSAYVSRGVVWDKQDPYNYLWYERPQLKDGDVRAIRKQTRNIAEKLEELVSSVQ